MIMEKEVETSVLLKATLSYAQCGWKVFPVFEPVVREEAVICSCGNPKCGSVGKHPRSQQGFKDATTDESSIRSWWTDWPNANIGIVTGKASRLLVIDVDGPQGKTSLNQLQEEHGFLPLTLQATTGKGFHLYFQLPEDIEISCSVGKLGEGIDVRGEGGYVIAPPSLHAFGTSYTWSNKGTKLAELPQHWVDLLTKGNKFDSKKGETPTDMSENGFCPPSIPEGTRNNTLFQRAARLNANGLPQEEIAGILSEWNETECSAPLKDCELKRVGESAASYNRPSFPLTDMGNAERFVSHSHEVVRYCDDYGKWFCYENGKWYMDKGSRVLQFAKQTVRSILKEAAESTSQTLYRDLLSHARKSESARSLNSLVSLAKSDPKIAVSLEEFDADPLLLNVQNGVVDLRTGHLIPHSPKYLCTRMAKVSYDKEAECKEFLRFLDTVTEGDPELKRYLQVLAGYVLTGLTSEQAFFMIMGRGANGKSTLVHILTDMMGDYAMTTPSSTFTVHKNESIRNDLARLNGARLVTTSEFDPGQVMSEALMKQSTGGERIASRFLQNEYFEYYPIFKIVSTTNHLPKIRGSDIGIWRRVQVIPFNHQLSENKQDKCLVDKLLLELPGILNWAVEGSMIWQREGLRKPDCVKWTIEEYKSDMDGLSDFFDQCVEFIPSSKTATRDLYTSYKIWAAGAGEEEVSMKRFSSMLKERGYTKTRDHRLGMIWHGLNLKMSNGSVTP